MGRQVATQGLGLTCALLQRHAVAHVDVVYSDAASGWVIKESLKHHLNERERETQIDIVLVSVSNIKGGVMISVKDPL